MKYVLFPDGTYVWVPEAEDVARSALRQLSNYAKANEAAAEEERQGRAKGGRSRAGKFPAGVEALFEAAYALAKKGYKRIGDARVAHEARRLLKLAKENPHKLTAEDLKEHDARRWRELRRHK